ncbi:hypothetical protein BGW36DRAFT_400040 [Talaromyces proteolyticus]|uniref:Uncharacterized protein n=1 Tax=Talaromyces proteolyticus TaxID=1131652 RepID=A0AAD4PWQ2_9EURO|nr:uncharacterized protein BGW36DRAFT_400040 [Talaromyces proteolyticus]KAH8691874.1 hypothetical protein BGW36DRAFT_400040 [Talaromyces proteolyticus]
MPFLGLARKKTAQRKTEHGGKNYLLYLQRRREHEKQRTQPLFSRHTNIQAASVRGKLTRFCEEYSIHDVNDFLQHLTIGDVKTWFDWIRENFQGSIKSHHALGTYWRTLKRLHYLKHEKDMEASMERECVNYYNYTSRMMGLRRHALPKPTASSIDLLEFQVAHLVHCTSVFPDEKQRLYVTVALNLSSVTACRAVSLRGGASSDSGYPTRNSNAEPDHALDSGYASDSSVVTDDGYLSGQAVAIEAVLWRHVEFYILRNPKRGARHVLAAIVTLIHTKGKKARVKRFVIQHEDNLLFDLLSQLFALGLDDDIFKADIRDEADIYTVPIPSHRKALQLKIKREKLDIPVFREPERTEDGYRTSEKTPLKRSTFARYLKRIGLITGEKTGLTQKWVRRGGINAINENAPPEVRDQVADHESNAVMYYLNEIISCDTAAAFHQRASDEVVQREMRSATLLADRTAPIRLTDEQSSKIQNHPEVQRLRAICQQLTEEIYQQGNTVKEAKATGTELSLQKKEADAELNRTITGLREKELNKNRMRYFRNTDTETFNQQYKIDSTSQQRESQSLTSIRYTIPEREESVRLLCYSISVQTEDEIHSRRLKFIRLMVRWQKRQEAPRRGRQMVTMSQPPPSPPPPLSLAMQPDNIPLKFHPLQCPFCLSNPGLPPGQRAKKKSKTNKLWDHVENRHRKELAAFESGNRACGLCFLSEVVFKPSSVSDFKRHTGDIHSIPLRPLRLPLQGL